MKFSCIIFHQAYARLVRITMPFIFSTFLERHRRINLLSILCVGKLRPREATETHHSGEKAKQGQSWKMLVDGVDSLFLTLGS